jgi:hypothetical protein
MDDGNNNILIARVAHELSRIAKQSGAAVLVLHHLRKGSSGDVDDLMGATSLRANFRNCRIYQRMTSDQADELKVPANQRWRYLRIASVKANYAPPPDDCIWFSLASVLLGNANDLYTEGDEIGVAVPWKPPSAFDGLDRPTMGSIFAHLRREPSPGWRWSLNSKQKHWAGKVLLDLAPDMSREQAKRVLDTWHKNGAISEETYVNPNRDEATGIVLNEELISRMLPPSRDENE